MVVVNWSMIPFSVSRTVLAIKLSKAHTKYIPDILWPVTELNSIIEYWQHAKKSKILFDFLSLLFSSRIYIFFFIR